MKNLELSGLNLSLMNSMELNATEGGVGCPNAKNFWSCDWIVYFEGCIPVRIPRKN